MTKVLIITNKEDITSDFIIEELKNRKIEFYRFNTEDLNSACSVNLNFSNDKFCLVDHIIQKEFDLKSFTSVYFRRPKLPIYKINRINTSERQFLRNEAFYTLEGIYKIVNDAFWLNPIYAIREAENKIYQLELAKSIGFTIPDSIVTNIFSEALKFYDNVDGNCVIKPIKSGLIGNDANAKIIFTSKLTSRPSSKGKIESSPNFLQKEIKKEYDVRVIVVGNKVFTTLIHSQEKEETQIDWRRGENFLKHTPTILPPNINRKCIELLHRLSLRFGAIDFVLDITGNYIFLEINPNGQWAWIEQRTNYAISTEIVNLLRDGNI